MTLSPFLNFDPPPNPCPNLPLSPCLLTAPPQRMPARTTVSNTRLHLAKSNLKFARLNWKKVIFVDEKLFHSDDSDAFAYMKQGGARPGRQRFPARVHVYGMIGHGIKELVVLPPTDRVDSKLYLDKCLKPFEKLFKGRFLLMDGAGCHRDKAVEEWLTLKKIQTVEHPAESPDMNPIEQLWVHLSARGPLTEEGLERFVVAEWKKMPQAMVNRFAGSWVRMLEAVVAKKGATSCRNLAK